MWLIAKYYFPCVCCLLAVRAHARCTRAAHSERGLVEASLLLGYSCCTRSVVSRKRRPGTFRLRFSPWVGEATLDRFSLLSHSSKYLLYCTYVCIYMYGIQQLAACNMKYATQPRRTTSTNTNKRGTCTRSNESSPPRTHTRYQVRTVLVGYTTTYVRRTLQQAVYTYLSIYHIFLLYQPQVFYKLIEKIQQRHAYTFTYHTTTQWAYAMVIYFCLMLLPSVLLFLLDCLLPLLLCCLEKMTSCLVVESSLTPY